MRILQVCNLTDRATNLPRWHSLQEEHEVLTMHLSGWAPSRLSGVVGRAAQIGAAIAWHLGRPWDATRVNHELPSVAEAFQPEVIWVDKGNALRPDTLRQAKQVCRAKLVAFSLDDMALPHNRSEYFRQCLPLYDLVVTTKQANIAGRELEALGAKRVLFVPQGYAPSAHRPMPLDRPDDERWRCDVAFLGAWEEVRAASILRLARAGIPVRVYGGGARWDAVARENPLVDARPAAWGDDYARAISGSRVCLCFLRKLNRDTHTSRTFEIPACGALLLGERTDEHLSFFEEGREALFFSSDDELLTQVQSLLADEPRRAAIAAAGHRRCLESGYDYGTQLRRVLSALF